MFAFMVDHEFQRENWKSLALWRGKRARVRFRVIKNHKGIEVLIKKNIIWLLYCLWRHQAWQSSWRRWVIDSKLIFLLGIDFLNQ